MQAETQSTEHNAQPSTTGTRTDIHNESLCVTLILNVALIIETQYIL